MSVNPAPGERRRRLTAAERERQILDVAEDLFTRRGLEGVSIEDIARAAGVSRPIVYQHHGAKDEVFLACVRRARAEFGDQIERSLAAVRGSDDPAALAEAGGRPFFDMIEQNPRRWVLLFTTSASLDSRLAAQLADLRADTVATIEKVVRASTRHLDASAASALAWAISGIGELLGRWWLRHQEVPKTRVLVLYRTIVVRGAVGIVEEFGSGPTA